MSSCIGTTGTIACPQLSTLKSQGSMLRVETSDLRVVEFAAYCLRELESRRAAAQVPRSNTPCNQYVTERAHDAIGACGFADVAQHHHRREQQRGGVCQLFACDVGRAAVHGLEH